MTKTTKDGLKNNKKIDKVSKKENDLKKANTTNKKEVKTSTKKTAKTESKNIKKTTTKKASNKTKKSSSKNLKKYDILEYYDLHTPLRKILSDWGFFGRWRSSPFRRCLCT